MIRILRHYHSVIFMALVPLNMLAMDAYAQVNTAPSVPLDQSVEEVMLPQKPVIFSKNMPSIFFMDNEVNAIEQAKKKFYGRNIRSPESEQDLLDQIKDINAVQKPKEDFQEKHYAQFYLETLLYHTPLDWMIWVRELGDGKKYTPLTLEKPTDKLKIIEIEKEKVTFEWKPINWPYVIETFKPTSNISLNHDRKIVIFSLGVNQTMHGFDMQIKEGVTPLVPVVDKDTSKNKDDKEPAISNEQPVISNKQKDKTILDLYKGLESE